MPFFAPCSFISCLYVLRCIILLRFIHLIFFSLSCYGTIAFASLHIYACILKWSNDEREREKNQLWECDCKHSANNVLYLLFCVVRLRPLALQRFVSATTVNFVSMHSMQNKTTNKITAVDDSVELDDEEKKNNIVERLRMTLLATMLLTLYLCVISFCKKKKNSLCICAQNGFWPEKLRSFSVLSR